MAEIGTAELIYINASSINGYFFDAILETTHDSELAITTHPVQVGADIADHSYLEAQKVTMRVGMSDVMQDVVAGQFASPSRSVSAFQTLQELQASRIPFRIQTHYRAYDNMLIKALSSHDDSATMNGLDCTVTMQEIMVAQTMTVKVSKRPATTQPADSGVLSVRDVNETILYANPALGNAFQSVAGFLDSLF
jgi:hypothetical protein